MKILLATDGSDCSRAAAKSLASRPLAPGTRIKILSVIEMPLSVVPETWILPDGYYDEIERVSRERAGGAVDEAKQLIAEAHGADIEIESEVVGGSPKVVIPDVAEAWGADLVVVGSHGYRGLERFLLGSVSMSVAQHLHCSVEIVRTAPAEAVT